MLNNNFRYQPFVSVSGNLGGKVPSVDNVLSSHEQDIYPITSLVENCIEFEFQTDRNNYVDLRQSLIALKLKFVKGFVNNQQIYNSNGLYSHRSYISIKLKGAITEHREFCIVKAMTMSRIPRILLTQYLIPFLRGE